MDNKFLRYLFGFILLILIILSLNNPVFLILMSALFIILAMREYRNMFKNKDIIPCRYIPEITGILMAVCFVYGTNIIPVLVLGFIAAFIKVVIKNQKPYMLSAFSTVTAIIFIFFGLYIIKIAYFFGVYSNIYCILIYIAAVLLGDFAASKIGVKINSAKIAPEISPNKTLAGAIANFVMACLVCILFKYLCNIRLLQCITYAAAISIFSQFGDLTVSSIKRDLNIKHSSDLFKDYGGIWDRIDAFIFSAPAFYYCLLLLNF